MDTLTSAAQDLPAWLPSFTRILVLAPHPDDEVFGCFGLIDMARSLSCDVQVHIVTDGELCFGTLSAADTRALRRRRREESQAAARLLGFPEPHFWGMPDSRLLEHLESLEHKLHTLCTPGTLCVGTWMNDGHPDHEAVGLCVRQLQRLGACNALYYPVWSLVDPERKQQWEQQRGTRYSVPLTAAQTARKQAAAALFESQLLPDHSSSRLIVSPERLKYFVADQEWYWHED